ncbi:hypothetical protein [Streptomyces eurocidicus]|uniref:Uncharacterized protein n=1 Tax=Streptomyces eurocidicus TaxID=66423 RepID=A0A7W8BG63_STREU|nr:hypothetical protein [Streptomyces eurocidicus]MBB5122730.1 hypothetical protein [Streptomyces eurocidicus]MBF6055223.1 hypothetical protein [Streptomyces eurocidicus]
MRRQWWVAQTLTVSLLAGGALAGAPPASGNGPVFASASVGEPTGQVSALTAAAAGARGRVLYLAKWHPAAEVRVSAWNALRSSRGDEAVAEWLAPGGGFDYAKQRARDVRSRNKAFCERVVRTHTVEFSPEVRAAAERAVRGTAAEQAAFVRTGYAEAQRRDRAARETDAQHQQEAAAKERGFVGAIAAHDPGEQVRVAAQWALRAGATDADVVEFFGYGWMAGAALDLEGYRARIADAEVLRHHALSLLIRDAVAAEEALKGAADVAKARAEAERAWKAVAEHADTAGKAWLAEQEAAAAQAENWRTIADAARTGADELWKAIADPARANQDTWAREQAEAAEAAKSWKDMLDRAQDSAQRVKG